MNEHHRVHPLTPLLRTWSVLFALGLFAVTSFSEQTVELIRRLLSHDRQETLEALAIIVPVLAIAAAASTLWWRAISYTITDESITYRWGFFKRKVRSARLERAQAIDVVQPLHARIFGLAAVRVETAGGVNSRVEIRYLRKGTAVLLKEQLLGSEAEGELLVAPIPVYRTLLSSLFSVSAVVTLFFTGMTVGFELSAATMVPVLVATVPNIWRTIDGSYQFTARKVGNTINVAYGLANLQRKTLEINRAHAVIIRKPALWRPFGWWRVQVAVAGYGERYDGMTVLPVGDKQTAMKLCEILMGYAVDPDTPYRPQYRSPKRARWVSPVDASRQAFELTPTYVIEHRGRVGRRAAIAFRRHVQAISVRIGPVQRLVNVATVRLHLVRGPVKMTGRDLPTKKAQELLGRLHGQH